MENILPKKVLIVEDDKSLLDILVYKVKEEGFKVLKASDGEKALVYAMTKKPDIVLLDLHVPNLNGRELLKLIRSNEGTKHLPVIILTNDSSSGSIEDTLEQAAPAYFIKAETDLVSIIESIKYHLAAAI